MKKLAFTLIALFTALTIFGSFSRLAQAQTPAQDVCSGIGQVTNNANATDPCAEPQNGGSVQSTIVVAVNILSWVVGIAAVIVVIFGGFRYVTSGGDSTKIGSAKNTILYAIIGLVVVAMAQVIVRFTLNKAIGNVPATLPAGCTNAQRKNGEC